MAERSKLRVGIIMAGGAGERFWPLSRRIRPKQLLCLTRPDKSMLSEAIDRLAAVVGLEQVHIITGEHLVHPICAAEPDLPPDHVLAEPSKRNTSGALAYSAAWLLARYPEYDPDAITLAITTADHRIGDEGRFKATVEAALIAAEEQNALVTCGIMPTHPETGFGYIEARDEAPVQGGSNGCPPVYRANAFHEKPDSARAGEFLATGRHFWNSGMFFWKLSTFLKELQDAQPAMAGAVEAMAQALKAGDKAATERAFNSIESISIDYALMEKSPHVLVVKSDFPWADVGAWNAIATPEECDPNGNYTVGDPVVIDSADCVVYNDAGIGKMAVGVVGMRDTIIVTTQDAVLVLPRERAQDVRAVVEALKRKNATQL